MVLMTLDGRIGYIEAIMPTKTRKKNELSRRSIGASRNHFEAEDCHHLLFSIECKHRNQRNYPARLPFRNSFRKS